MLITPLTPKKILVERGAIRQFPCLIEGIGASRVLFVSPRSIVASPQFQWVNEELKKMGMKTDYHLANREPSFSDVSECLEKAVQFEPDIIVGYGGTSALDLAKGVGVLYPPDCKELLSPLEISKFFYDKTRIKQKKVPIVEVDTTAGGAGGVTFYVVFYSYDLNMKKGASDPAFMPDYLIIDPELLLSMPPDVALSGHLDALAHLAESGTGRDANPISDAFVFRGLEIIAENIYLSCKGDPEARMMMAEASLLGGMAIQQSDVYAHVLGYPIHDLLRKRGIIVPHGFLCGMMLMPVFRYIEQIGAATDKMKEIVKILEKIQPSPFDLLKELKKSTLTQLGLKKDDIEKELLKGVMDRAPNELFAPPIEMTKEHVRAIYHSVL